MSIPSGPLDPITAALSDQVMRLLRAPALVSNRGDAAQPLLSSGGSLQVTYRSVHAAMVGAASLRLYYANRRYLLSAGETTPAFGYTLKATFEAPSGALLPVLFGGARSVVVDPGLEVVSDPIPVRLDAGQVFYVRSSPLAAALGQPWPIAGGSNPGTLAGGGHAAGDACDSASSVFTGASVPFGPAAVVGIPLGFVPAVAAIAGDSVAYGSGDTLALNGDYGFLARALSLSGVPHFKVASPGSAMADLVGTTDADLVHRTLFHRSWLDRFRPTHAAISMANNDVHNAGATLGRLQAAFLRWCDWWAGNGVLIACTTISPRTTGSWTTLGGQTKSPATVNTKRRAFNAWLMSRPHPAITRVWDLAAMVQAPTDADLWRVEGGAWTKDGTHPSPLAHASVARAILAQGQLWPSA